MKSYALSEEAQLQLFEAFDYLADRSLPAAVKWHHTMLEAFQHLAVWPRSGKLRPDFAPGFLRFWIVDEYVVLYDPESDPVRVITILHGARDVENILANRYQSMEHLDEPENNE